MELIHSCHSSANALLTYFQFSDKERDMFGETGAYRGPYHGPLFSTREQAFMDFLVTELRTKSTSALLLSTFLVIEDTDFFFQERN
jgi:hypothetical protein